MSINWRNIADVGNPTDNNKSYLVTDGKEISTTSISCKWISKNEWSFLKWSGDENTYEDNSCCSGEIMFDILPTHWCPTDEINLPK